ncbi:MAG: hypothetical protein JWN03_6493 [Nocardia sp.]|nr:hypothetical protein [Nocardia sp.]
MRTSLRSSIKSHSILGHDGEWAREAHQTMIGVTDSGLTAVQHR